MFPVVGHCPGGSIAIGGKTYAMQPHGFARHSRFDVVAAGADHCTMLLGSSSATKQSYPFEFALEQSYRLDGSTLTMAAVVRNLDTRTMPFTFGFHPGFAWPERGTDAAHLRLGNRSEPPLVRLAPEGTLDSRRHELFRDGNATLAGAVLDAGTLAFEGSSESIALLLGGRPIDLALTNLPNLLVWTKPGAGFLCIEPSHGLPARAAGDSALEARPFAINLSGGECRSFSLAITLGGSAQH